MRSLLGGSQPTLPLSNILFSWWRGCDTKGEEEGTFSSSFPSLLRPALARPSPIIWPDIQSQFSSLSLVCVCVSLVEGSGLEGILSSTTSTSRKVLSKRWLASHYDTKLWKVILLFSKLVRCYLKVGVWCLLPLRKQPFFILVVAGQGALCLKKVI